MDVHHLPPSEKSLYVEDEDELMENIYRNYGYYLNRAHAISGSTLRMTIERLYEYYNAVHTRRRVELLRLLSVIPDMFDIEHNVPQPEQSVILFGEPRENETSRELLRRFRAGRLPKEEMQPKQGPEASATVSDAAATVPASQLLDSLEQLTSTEAQQDTAQLSHLLRSPDLYPLMLDQPQTLSLAIVCRETQLGASCQNHRCSQLHTRQLRPTRLPICFGNRYRACSLKHTCPLQHRMPLLVRARHRAMKCLDRAGVCMYVPVRRAMDAIDAGYAHLAKKDLAQSSMFLDEYTFFLGTKEAGRVVKIHVPDDTETGSDNHDSDMASCETLEPLSLLSSSAEADTRLNKLYLAIRRPLESTLLATNDPDDLRGRLQLLLPVGTETTAAHLAQLYAHAFHHPLPLTELTPSDNPRLFLRWLRTRGLRVDGDGQVTYTEERDTVHAYRAERPIRALSAITEEPLPTLPLHRMCRIAKSAGIR